MGRLVSMTRKFREVFLNPVIVQCGVNQGGVFVEIPWRLTRAYSRAYALSRDRGGFRLRGLSAILRTAQLDRLIKTKCGTLYFNHRIAPSYACLVSGDWIEPETHEFLDAMIRLSNRAIMFIDIGSSIGEFVLHASTLPQVRRIVAFEPEPEHAKALRVTAQLNDWQHVSIRAVALSDRAGSASFLVNERCGTSSHLASDSGGAQAGRLTVVECSTLDEEMARCDDPDLPIVILIDVEGGELRACAGGRDFIGRRRPLIIFEYHQNTKQSWRLNELRELLGREYEVFRLRSDGRLDNDCENAWNCVACDRNGPFWGPLSGLIVADR